MQRITEFKTGKKSIFKVETVIDGAVVDSKIINVQIDTVTVKNKEYNLLYNSSYELIEDAYNFLNHNQKRLSANSIKAEMYALRYLYVFREIIDKPIAEFTRIDFLKLNYFLSGVSADGSEVEYNLLTKRNSETINSFFSVYRELYRYLDLTSAPILNERSFAKYTPAGRRNKSANITNVEVPKYISVEEFQKIISYIRNNISDKERRLRDECIVRIMYEGGCRLGEVLGSTLEDYVIQEVDNNEICFVYIRNRITDRNFQNAKTCMNITSRSNYRQNEYEVNGVGYQLTFLNMDTYDTICEYIDIAHDRAYKKHKDTYNKNVADAVGEYKKQNTTNYYLFLNNRGEPLSDEGWNKELRMIFKAVGISVDSHSRKDNLSHRFRHGFVMHLIYDLKMPREQVMRRTRHKNYASLDAYYNPTTEQIVKMKLDIEDMILKGDKKLDE